VFRLARLARQPERNDPEPVATAGASVEERIVAALRTVYDPEIPVNVYDLGLIYAIEVGVDGGVDIRMTLTAPACPVAGMMPGRVESAVRTVDGVAAVDVELVWDPPWTKERMSDEARLQLGLL
jgi:FeS assembly SUF system protein